MKRERNRKRRSWGSKGRRREDLTQITLRTQRSQRREDKGGGPACGGPPLHFLVEFSGRGRNLRGFGPGRLFVSRLDGACDNRRWRRACRANSRGRIGCGVPRRGRRRFCREFLSW